MTFLPGADFQDPKYRPMAMNKLRELLFQERQREQAAAGQGPSMFRVGTPTGLNPADRTGYSEMLNRQSSIADIGRRLGGKGGLDVEARYPGPISSGWDRMMTGNALMGQMAGGPAGQTQMALLSQLLRRR